MKRVPFLLLVVVLGVAGCTAGAAPDVEGGDGGVVSGEGVGEGVRERERWDAAALGDYRYDFQQQCFCVREQVQPVTIEVRGGRVARVVSRETGAEVAASDGLRWYTVPELFEVIAEARRNGVTPLVVRYDAELGYPTHIEAGSLAADAGTIYSASNLQRIAP
jgi:hypothetical protein